MSVCDFTKANILKSILCLQRGIPKIAYPAVKLPSPGYDEAEDGGFLAKLLEIVTVSTRPASAKEILAMLIKARHLIKNLSKASRNL